MQFFGLKIRVYENSFLSLTDVKQGSVGPPDIHTAPPSGLVEECTSGCLPSNLLGEDSKAWPEMPPFNVPAVGATAMRGTLHIFHRCVFGDRQNDLNHTPPHTATLSRDKQRAEEANRNTPLKREKVARRTSR